MYWFGTMHAGWAKNKTHKTSTFKQMINGVATCCPGRILEHPISKSTGGGFTVQMGHLVCKVDPVIK